WNDQEMGYIPPDVFFQVAKETNQLHRLDSYMVKKSLDSFAKLREKKEYQKAKLTINITPTTLLDKNFFDYFNELVDSHSMSHDDIFIEISETTFINNHNICLERINQFKEKGYLIALDDFGTEYSSLSILEIVDFDIIKIDAHFVQNIDKFNNKEIIKMIRTITSRISKEIVAEGVETKAQSEALVELGCQIQQGYFLHRPENLLQY
nr:EAL domain-containing protein [Bacillota bacterium]